MLFTFSSQLIEFNHVKPIFQLLLLSTLNMPPNTKTEILDISSCKIQMFMHIPRILYVWIYLFSKQNRIIDWLSPTTSRPNREN